MKITIDTQVDTYEDIKKVLHILTNIIEQKESSAPASNFPEKNPTDTTNLMSMFTDDSASVQKTIPDTPPNFSNFLNLVNGKNNPEPRSDKPRIEFY